MCKGVFPKVLELGLDKKDIEGHLRLYYFN